MTHTGRNNNSARQNIFLRANSLQQIYTCCLHVTKSRPKRTNDYHAERRVAVALDARAAVPSARDRARRETPMATTDARVDPAHGEPAPSRCAVGDLPGASSNHSSPALARGVRLRGKPSTRAHSAREMRPPRARGPSSRERAFPRASRDVDASPSFQTPRRSSRLAAPRISRPRPRAARDIAYQEGRACSSPRPRARFVTSGG